MAALLDILLYLISMATLLCGVYAIGSYRRARLGPGYRGEKDVAVWLALAAWLFVFLLLLIARAAHPPAS
jgi:hypothetical protein